jgi:hypothetical protein
MKTGLDKQGIYGKNSAHVKTFAGPRIIAGFGKISGFPPPSPE